MPQHCRQAVQRSFSSTHSTSAQCLLSATSASSHLQLLVSTVAPLEHAKQGCDAAEREASASGSLMAAEGLPAPEEISAVMASPTQHHLPAPPQGQAASGASPGQLFPQHPRRPWGVPCQQGAMLGSAAVPAMPCSSSLHEISQ